MSPAKLQSTLQTALALHQQGRLPEAEKLYVQLRASWPRNFDVLHLSGALAYQQGRYKEALDLLTRALTISPASVPCTMRVGLAHVALGHAAKGEDFLRRVTLREPNNYDAWAGLAVALRQVGKIDEAIAAYEKVAAIDPRAAEPHAIIGGLINESQGPAAAIPHFERALQLNPKYAVAWCNLGIARIGQHNYGEAQRALDRAIEEDPTLVQAITARAIVAQQTYQLDAALTYFDRALALAPAHTEARSGKLLTLNYLSDLPPAAVFTEHRLFGQHSEPPNAPAVLLTPSQSTKRPLRVGIVSPDLRAHSIAYFLEPLLQHLNREDFEIFLYHNHAKVDFMSERLRVHARSWKNLVGQTDTAAEKILRADNLDIAIDLAGHTGFNRLACFAQRIAPVQMTYLGYPNTTGLKTMDFRFVDAITDPLGSDDEFYTEKRIRFSSCAWAFSPPKNSPSPARSEGTPFTFGSFNNPSKLSEATLSLWQRLLTRVPDARLLLKGTGLTEPVTGSVMEKKLQAVGIDVQRVDLLDRTPNLASHLEIYHRIDVALDPFPYHGTTTTCEALWMGVPLVTLRGDRHAARVGASLLTAVSHPEWIAESEEGYLEIAARLAADRSRLLRLRQTLRADLESSVLLDHAGQAARFGDALRACWQAACLGKVNTSISAFTSAILHETSVGHLTN